MGTNTLLPHTFPREHDNDNHNLSRPPLQIEQEIDI